MPDFPYAESNGLAGRTAADVVEMFFSGVVQETPPKAVLVVGGIASGKTTHRKAKYAEGFVHIDPADLYLALTKDDAEVGDDIVERLEEAGARLCARALCEKRNLVLELVIAEVEPAESVIAVLKSHGYEVAMDGIHCDKEEAVRRNSERDEINISCYFTQKMLLRWLSVHGA